MRPALNSIIKLAVLGLLFAGVIFCGKVSAQDDLPKHEVVYEFDLAPKNGRVIHVAVHDPNLSREDCLALIEYYRDDVGPEGQVAVQKPSKILNNTLAPFCVLNADEPPATFNTDFFKD